mgnify:CR=1 FL=1
MIHFGLWGQKRLLRRLNSFGVGCFGVKRVERVKKALALELALAIWVESV